MRRVAAIFAGWGLATLLAIAVAWQGVGFVSRAVTDRRPAALSAAEVQEELNGTAGVVVDGARTTIAATPTTGTAGEGPIPAVDPSATSAPAPTSSLSTTSTSTSTSTSGPAPAPAPAAVADARSETRTYRTTGGAAAVRFEPGGVTLVWATPEAGFEARVSQSSPGEISVRFRSDDHESRIDASWEGGPVDEVEENAR